ncbi:MAG: hypothetical protein VKN33_08225 [Candidatus Sericytochromatia bacterium]|jgi:hypothetical protein|nr:hypothetical protein [Candidatus Sericytochromatia bacterium]
MPTKDLWFLPSGGPGRHYLLDYEPVVLEKAGKALSVKMYRKYAAGEVSREPSFHVFLAFATITTAQLNRTFGADDSAMEAFLLKTAERAAACLDMRLPPPVEDPVPLGLIVWLSVGDYASERALTHTLVEALG